MSSAETLLDGWQEGVDLHMAQLMPLPLAVSCFSKIQIDFTFLVLAHLGSPRKRPLNGCSCAVVRQQIKYITKMATTLRKCHRLNF